MFRHGRERGVLAEKQMGSANIVWESAPDLAAEARRGETARRCNVRSTAIGRGVRRHRNSQMQRRRALAL